MRSDILKMPDVCGPQCTLWPTCARKTTCPVRQRTLEKKSFGKSRKLFPTDEELEELIKEEMEK